MFNYTVEMKDSNISWIGEIPENWNIYSLKHVVNEFIAGGTPISSNDEFWDDNNGIPWVAIGDMNDGGYINSTTKSITHEGLVDKNLRILKKGTLIYSIFASLGKTSILNIDATINQAILGLITSKKINDFYLKYYLEALKSTISSYSNENTQENLNSNIVKNMEIAMPTSLEIQGNIANYLDKQTNKINKSITKNIELINLLEEKRTCLINHVVTKGLDPDVPMKDSCVGWISEIPENYINVKLKFLTSKIGSGKTPKGGSEVYVSEGIPLLRSQNINFDSIKLDDVVYTIEEQKRIVSFLEQEINIIYESVNRVKEVISLLEEYKTSLVYHVVTGKIDINNGA